MFSTENDALCSVLFLYLPCGIGTTTNQPLVSGVSSWQRGVCAGMPHTHGDALAHFHTCTRAAVPACHALPAHTPLVHVCGGVVCCVLCVVCCVRCVVCVMEYTLLYTMSSDSPGRTGDPRPTDMGLATRGSCRGTRDSRLATRSPGRGTHYSRLMPRDLRLTSRDPQPL